MRDGAGSAPPRAMSLRDLPSVDHLLKQPAVATLLDEFPRAELTRCIGLVLDACREEIRRGRQTSLRLQDLALRIREQLYLRARPHLRPVINATGIVLHTGLGRAPLAGEAVEAIADVAAGYSNLELDLDSGRRGDRRAHVRALLCELTGAEDALVVNNNAAGTYLCLSTLAAGHGVIVSRGQLVEIGGSYRMPDIMVAAGCRMVEVGTTNRTHLRDYQDAIDADTRVLLRVHPSNYRIEGFVTSPALRELVELARRTGRDDVHVIDDLGSGLLLHREQHAPNSPTAELSCVWDEPTVPDSVASGADLTLFSGDKLLGGPQAGIIVGRAALIARLSGNPLMRTFRPDKLTLAGLEATLRLYRDPDALLRRLPVLRMLAADQNALQSTAERLAEAIRVHAPHLDADCAPDESQAGGGSLPTTPFPTWAVRVRHRDLRPDELSAALRQRDLPIIGRIKDEQLLFDCRTLAEDDVEQIAVALAEVTRELGG